MGVGQIEHPVVRPPMTKVAPSAEKVSIGIRQAIGRGSVAAVDVESLALVTSIGRSSLTIS
jgi:hypothetical protein